jgi:lipase chaperone LimK
MRTAFLLAVLLGLVGCAAQAGVRSVDEVRASGSLRGSDLDGDWGVWRQGSLQSDTALRRRFDHLLTAVGELDLRELRRWIAREVLREHGAAAVSQVLSAWDEHLALRQGKPTPHQEAAGNPAPPTPPARRAAEPLPRALLLPELPLGIEQQQAVQAQRVQQFGAEAAERLRLEDAARSAWAQRLAEARAQLQVLSGAAREGYLAQHFSGAERLRARTLLGFPP